MTLDRDSGVAAWYEATSIPQTVVVDREGQIARLFVDGGSQLPGHLREALKALVTGPGARAAGQGNGE